MQLQKTYKGDSRFNLGDKDFDVDLKQKAKLPETMLGSLSKRENDLLFKPRTEKLSLLDQIAIPKDKDSDDELMQWDHEIDTQAEK